MSHINSDCRISSTIHSAPKTLENQTNSPLNSKTDWEFISYVRGCLVSTELLKRLDDSSEEVRSVALQAVGLWLSSLTKDYNLELCTAHLQFLFQQLLLHLDDPDASVQDQVLGENGWGV